ncbi:MAG: hypothetical protein E7384_07140 [Ruminococcaceae bacterium]|nr:hypothetical protein [Oscillospiraceae bacterium]
MRNFKRFLCLFLAVLAIFAFTACGSDSDNNGNGGNTGGSGGKDSNKGNGSSVVNISADIKSAMKASDHLTGTYFFLADDGTIYTLADKSEKGFADVYTKLPNVRKLSLSNIGTVVFALTDNGNLYYKEEKVASDVKDISYCTTNSNIEGYCIVGNDIIWINREQLYEVPKTDEFKNVITGDKASGNFVSIEVDKHDFVVLNDKGDVFMNIGGSSDAYNELDFSNFKDMALVDIAKLTGNDIGKLGVDIAALTVAG